MANNSLNELVMSLSRDGRMNLRRSTKRKSKYFCRQNSANCLVVVGAMAAAIPNLGDYITLIGAFSSSMLALIFPPIIDVLTFYAPQDREAEPLLSGDSGSVGGRYVEKSTFQHVEEGKSLKY